MKTLCLTSHGTSFTVCYDDDDDPVVQQYSWYIHSHGYVGGSKSGIGARKAKAVYMHRLFMQPGMGDTVDHINGNRVDNRRCNLRNVPQSINNLNQNNRMRKNNTHGFRGVSLHKKTNRWQARVTINKTRINIGYYDTPEEASAAYKAEIKRRLPAQCLESRPAPVILHSDP